MKNKTLFADMGMVIVTIVWGYGFIATRIAVEYISTYQIIFYRFLISAILLTAIFFKDIKAANMRDIKNSLILGGFLCAGFLTQTEAIKYTTVAKNAFLTTLNVIFVPLIVAAIHKKKIDGYSKAGCLLAVTGTGILSLNMDFSVNFGDVLSIMCAVFFSFHIYFLGEFVKESKVSILAAGQIIGVAVFAFFPALFMGGLRFTGEPRAVAGVLYLALFSTCFCFLTQTYCQKFTSQIKAVIIFSLEAVFASIFAVIIFKDSITPRFLAGSALIFTAVIISSTKLEFLRKKGVRIIEDSN